METLWFLFKNVHCKMLCAKYCPFCSGQIVQCDLRWWTPFLAAIKFTDVVSVLIALKYSTHFEWSQINFLAHICGGGGHMHLYIFFSCDQAALQMVFSVRPSVCLSVRLSVCPSVRLSVTPFWLCSHHHIIMKFSGVITSDRSDVHAKGQGQRSRSQRSQPNFTVSGL